MSSVLAARALRQTLREMRAASDLDHIDLDDVKKWRDTVVAWKNAAQAKLTDHEGRIAALEARLP